MDTRLLHVGFGGTVAAERILGVCDPNSAPIRRMVRKAKESDRAIDMTYGRKAKAVIVLDTGHIVLVALQPETIASRLEEKAPR